MAKYRKSTLERYDKPLSFWPLTVSDLVVKMLTCPPIKQKELKRHVRSRKISRLDGEILYDLVKRIVPRSMPEEVREEMQQEIVLAILSGEYSFEDFEGIKSQDFRRQVYKILPDRFKNISIDAPLNDEGLTLADMLEG